MGCCGKSSGGRKGRSRRVVRNKAVSPSVPTCWIVLADYGDEWDEQNEPDYPWSLVNSHPKRASMDGFSKWGIYRNKKDAAWRAGKILDHATLVEQWPIAEITKEISAAKGASPLIIPKRI